MSGSGLIQFVVNIVVLLAAGGIFFLSIDKVAPDPFFAKIGKIAIGAMLIIALILAIAAVFGMGGGSTAISPLGVVWFAIAVIVAVVVLYIVNLVLDWIAGNMGGGPWVTPVKYILGAIVLIALLLAAANTLFGYRIGGLVAPDSRRGQPFWIGDRAVAAVPSGTATDLYPMLMRWS